jgi:cytochrome c-type biogenesis protein CcmF
MIPELGQFALILALCMALIQCSLPLLGAARGQAAWTALARPAAWAQFTFVGLAYVCLTISFIQSDFSVAYAAHNSNTALPFIYRIAAVWGAHEGSLLLWALILCGWTVAVAAFSHSLPKEFAARVIAVMGLISVGFLLFMLLTSNPFERLFPAPADGRDLNPLLQDPGLIIHPPMLYLGYVGFSVAFSFAIAALLSGKLDSEWARWSRPWTTVAWVFLTLGITLGSWWAYNELGWGGWWFWDPVENASFMPWLLGTALIHSLAVTDKRDSAKNWTLLLSIFAFSLSLLGTFLVRSGVITSVHAFATDPARGVFILIFLGIVVGGSLVLYAWRAPQAKDTVTFSLLSRETILLGNSVFFSVATATVLLGTLYPLFLDALGLGKISVGPPYFNTVFVPLMVPVVVLAGIGPLTRWKHQDWRPLWQRLRVVLIASLAAGLLLAWAMGGSRWPQAALGLTLAAWLVFSLCRDILFQIRHRRSLLSGLLALRRGYYGMWLAHLGVAVFVVGVTLTSLYSVERDVRMAPGDSVGIGPYNFELLSVGDGTGPNYDTKIGSVRVTEDNRAVATLFPEKRIYRVQRNPMTEAAIDIAPSRDLYVALGEPLGGEAWSVRLYVKPFIRWIWAGAVFMAVGGLLGATDKRYRKLLRQRRIAADREEPGMLAEGIAR